MDKKESSSATSSAKATAVKKPAADKEKKENSTKKTETLKLKGRYTGVVGKRKEAVARVRMYKNGSGLIIVNKKSFKEYFPVIQQSVIQQPLKLTGNLKSLNFSCLVRGGGKKGQSEAIRHAITNGLIKLDENYKPALKAKGWVTRDARKKERKKPGLKKARRAPQWSKR
ncbi:30S ribosomal protein S9 [Candidatus Parcubacteria bacterium]|nr:30S ribosomal protein S9 [Candidatus Parcubacteria bacterium]